MLIVLESGSASPTRPPVASARNADGTIAFKWAELRGSSILSSAQNGAAAAAIIKNKNAKHLIAFASPYFSFKLADDGLRDLRAGPWPRSFVGDFDEGESFLLERESGKWRFRTFHDALRVGPSEIFLSGGEVLSGDFVAFGAAGNEFATLTREGLVQAQTFMGTLRVKNLPIVHALFDGDIIRVWDADDEMHAFSSTTLQELEEVARVVVAREDLGLME